MGDHLDPGIARLLQHRLQHLRIVRHHADHIDALRDQVLDGAHLKGGVGARRADHEGIDAQFLGALLMPASIALNQGMPPILTTTPMLRFRGLAVAAMPTPSAKTPASRIRPSLLVMFPPPLLLALLFPGLGTGYFLTMCRQR